MVGQVDVTLVYEGLSFLTGLVSASLVPCMLTSVLLFIGVVFTLDTVHLSDDCSNFPLHFGQAYPKTCKCCGNLTFS
jgi:hypothetical protein